MASSRGKNASRTAGSGKRAANNKKTKRRVSRENKTAIGKEELRAMEVRRDIRLLLLLGVMVFVMLSELGMCGVAGRQVAKVMFGIFGLTAYVVPVFVLFLVIFIISNLGRRTLPFRVTALCALLITCGAAVDLYMSEPARAESFDPAAIYQRCAAGQSGGGVLGGSMAYGLYRILGGAGSALILVLITLICVMVLAQRSLISTVSRARQERIRSGGPSLIERGRERAAMRRQEAAERREYARLEQEKEREEREALLEKARENRRARTQRLKEQAMDPADLTGNTIRAAAEYETEEEDFGLDEGSSLFKRSRASRTRVREISDRKTKTTDVRGREELSQSQPDETIKVMDDAQPVVTEKTGTAEKAARNAASALFENMHISIAPVRRGKKAVPEQEEDDQERILRPDANTVRVESPGLFTSAGDPYPAQADTQKATMKVFAAASDEEEEDEHLQFPFEDDRDEGNVQRIYDSELLTSAQESAAAAASAPVYDIADAGGMSTFRAQRREAAQQAEKEAASAPVPAGEPAPPIDEKALEGIEVHRDRGSGVRTRAGATAVSAGQRNAENHQYVYPYFGLMEKGNSENSEESDRELKETAYRLQDTLRTFGVNITITDISKGPSVTRYELLPEQGVKVSKIVSLADDIKLSLAAMDIRIEAPIPGKRAIGIEVPNKSPSVVALRDILESREFRGAKSKLSFAVGKDLSGKTIVTDIAKMPHMLIAGATGSGKSVCINTIIMSLLFKASPQEVQLIMIDPKVVELSVYNGIPHLMIPVVTDAKKASAALAWATAEMDRRYKLFAAAGVRDLNGYNDMVKRKGSEAAEDEKILSRIVVIVDELADLMMVAKNDVEASICRLAQLARAAGIHLIIATQRPSVDVITGLIKANMPSRLAFAVASQVDSRTILDMAGAEKLIGKGDMLFYPQSYPKPARIQGAFISDEDVQNVVDYIKSNNSAALQDHDIDAAIDNMAASGAVPGEVPGDTGYDEHFVEAGRFIIDKNKASIGMLQRVFKIGFNRAARIMDQLAEAGVVSEENGTKARQVLMNMPQFEEYVQGMQ